MNGQPERPDTDIEDDDAVVEAEDAAETAADQQEAPGMEELQAKADENWDRYLRAAAEV
jgi:molecular chaperone GrpE (heat shock protein)